MSQRCVSRSVSAPGRDAGPRRPRLSCRSRPDAGSYDFRPALVARAKARLAAGFYDLPECLDVAADRMIAQQLSCL